MPILYLNKLLLAILFVATGFDNTLRYLWAAISCVKENVKDLSRLISHMPHGFTGISDFQIQQKHAMETICSING